MSQPTTTESSGLDELIGQRKAKLSALREKGVNPYPTTHAMSLSAEEIKSKYESLGQEESSEDELSFAGRLMTRRLMGKASFAHLQDRTGRMQIYVKRDDIGEDTFKDYKALVDPGDILGVVGTPFRTKTGEITLKVKSWRLLGKALRPPPEKFHGMTDVEVRYRRREVDLFSNEESKRRFLDRRRIVNTLRRELEGKNFIEVETPMMQPVPGGATAKPFVTHHEALDTQLYMRVAPELYLKRLLVGGLERVYEIGRAFRNEGIDTRHNPEFTILEAYQAYTNYEGMMDLVEHLIREAGKALKGDEALDFSYRGVPFSLKEPFARLSLQELFKKHVDLDYVSVCRDNSWRASAQKLGIGVAEDTPDHKCFERILDDKILPHVPPATFVHGYPAAFSPLAKAGAETPEVAERFELFIAGEEVANAYSEQNDPEVQRRHFTAQAQQLQAGDEEAMPADEEFLIALEHGMPPAGGLGIGIDRLTMLLTGTDSIREVILFPLLRPEKTS